MTNDTNDTTMTNDTNDTNDTTSTIDTDNAICAYGYRNGFRHSRETFRVTWSVNPDIPPQCVDMRRKECRDGRCGSEIVKGAAARDRAKYRAMLAVRKAVGAW